MKEAELENRNQMDSLICLFTLSDTLGRPIKQGEQVEVSFKIIMAPNCDASKYFNEKSVPKMKTVLSKSGEEFDAGLKSSEKVKMNTGSWMIGFKSLTFSKGSRKKSIHCVGTLNAGGTTITYAFFKFSFLLVLCLSCS